MKYTLVLVALLLFSCKNEKTTPSETALKTNTNKEKQVATPSQQENFSSAIRPGEQLNKGKEYSDEVEYVEYDDNGDYNLFTIKKGKETVALHTNFEGADKFLRGDILEITWKIDSTYSAGDGEKLDFTAWLIKSKKIKDGSVSLFKKKHKKPIKYYWAEEQEYSTSFKDYLYTLVEYYLANSKKELVKVNLQNPDANLVYSIESGDKDGRSYTILGISNEFENHTSIIQWLYLDTETRKLYEYDLPNDQLIEFK
ncbi:hypothetical protein [Flavobacterium poyangense]|uniref:hypothetical protein n=1 Tax=Flavobacterium poyangense TaxID=2204302 RepID=UPI00141E9EBD|nr:hypothetical protein [Flavobacterium sp. JXAS1]